jgi:hypothetical protein
MDLRIDDAAMKAMVAKSIVDSLTGEAREKLITDAIQSLLAAPRDGSNYYGSKISPLQQAFNSAVEQEARKYAADAISNDPVFKEQIAKLFADVAAKLFDEENRGVMVSNIANVIQRALTKDHY